MEFEFSKNLEVKDLSVVPVDLRGLYEQPEKEGPYRLRQDDATKGVVAAVTGLSTSLRAARAEAQGLKGKSVDLSVLGEYGTTVEEIAAGFKKSLTEAKKGNKSQEDFDRQIAKAKEDLGSEHKKVVEGLSKRTDALLKQLNHHLVDSAATSALAELKANVELALPHVLKHVRATEKDGAFIVEVVDAQGDIRYSGGSGKEMTVKELVAEMKSDPKFSALFQSESRSGGGTPPGNQQRRAADGNKGDRSPTEKIAAGLKANRRTYGARV